MKRKKTAKTSLGDLATAAGLSKSAVSYALRNYPSVSRETRERVQQLAREFGYSPDARMGLRMQGIRGAKTKELLPIAWLNCKEEEKAWSKHSFLSPYLEGARRRAQELGYRIDEIWARQPGMTMRRISQILYQRGIEGVIVSQPARHLRLNWGHLAVVSIDGSLLAPGLHRVMSDNTYNLMLSLKTLKRLGYRRIGICLTEQIDRYSQHLCRATALQHIHSTPVSQRVPPFFYIEDQAKAPQIARQVGVWLKKHRPDVIVGLDNHLVSWVEAAGFRVPQDIGVVHLALDDDVLEWAGIYSNKRETGATAAEWVISFLQNHRLGLPTIPLNTLVCGTWSSGCTLGSPKGKSRTLK